MQPGVRPLGHFQQVVHPQHYSQIPRYRYVEPEPLTTPKGRLVLTRFKEPWKIVRKMLGVVILTYVIANTTLIIPFGILENDAEFAFCGAFITLPLVAWFLSIRNPKLIHLQIAEPHPAGKRAHVLPNRQTLITPMPTKFRHHLIKDTGVLDIPQSKLLWIIFGIVLLITTNLFVALNAYPDNLIIILLVVLFAIPAWIVGFSVPVFAWWSYSTRKLEIPTQRHVSETLLIAGMLSTIPALIINSIISPLILETAGISENSHFFYFAILAISAPIGEELCKFGAVWLNRSMINSPRKGFQVGFTVGLGFAMLENLQYIMLSWGGGPISFTLTSLVRGIGSIPGHAFWTGLSGIGLGWIMMQQKKKKVLEEFNNDEIDVTKPEGVTSTDWILVDRNTGETVETTFESKKHRSPEEEIWNDLLYSYNPKSERESKGITGGLPLPSTTFRGITIAILSHSFWNGSSYGIEAGATKMGIGELGTVFLSIGWIIFLVIGLLMIGSGIMNGVINSPDKVE